MKPCKQKQQINALQGKIFGIGSGFHETRTMKHSRGTTGSRAHPGLLIIQVGLGSGAQGRWAELGGGDRGSDSAVRSFSVQLRETETVFTAFPDGRLRRRPGRWDKCGWSAKSRRPEAFFSQWQNTKHRYCLCCINIELQIFFFCLFVFSLRQ